MTPKRATTLDLDVDLEGGVIPISKAASSLAALLKRARERRQPIIVTQKGYPAGVILDIELYIEHHIHGVTPEQITWWWGHIDTTERHKRWHPRDHISFAWEVPPVGSHVGTVQVAREAIGGIPATLRIRFDDPAGVKTAFAHILVAAVIDREGRPIVRFTHAYEDAAGGTRMRSTFHLPPLLYALMGKGLRQHCREEMAHLSTFLPALYAEERGR